MAKLKIEKNILKCDSFLIQASSNVFFLTFLPQSPKVNQRTSVEILFLFPSLIFGIFFSIFFGIKITKKIWLKRLHF